MNQSVNEITIPVACFKFPTAMPFGAEPTRVPIPPIEADQATDKMAIVVKFSVLTYPFSCLLFCRLFAIPIANGIIIAEEAVLLTHIEINAVIIIIPKTIRWGDVENNFFDNNHEAHCCSTLCRVSAWARMNPPRKRNTIEEAKSNRIEFDMSGMIEE